MKKPIPFGKYALLERVNVGGMAEVFKAKAFGVEGFERLVAVKRILPSIAEDQEFITMFVDEAKIAVQLTHANIAQIFELGRVGDSHFIAMEYVHGKDLRAIFDRARKRGESLPVPMACYTVMKVCEGLDYAHNKKDPAGRELNLVHRDVSPQNILISYDGEIKIIDFGIAKAAGKAGKTQAGILKGKFGYMSPEQVRGLPLDRRSDIFAVGIVLYELLTGERLFVGESDFSTLEKVRNVEIMPPSTYNRRIPEELEQIVLKALAKDVDDRYQTAMDLHDDLQSFMYTSGHFFSRKDLSAYMRRAFADEIAKESQREEEYRRMEEDAAGGGSGLDAFANIESAPAKAGMAPQPRPPAPPSRAPKRTMMGLGAVPPPPPPPPRAGGTPPPPPRPGVASKPPALPTPMPSAPPPASPPASGLDMDWDDEELSTQIYDKPEDGLIPGLPEVAPIGGAAADVHSPAPRSPALDPVAVSATSSSPGQPPPGAPSPFDDLPAERSARSEPTAVTRNEEAKRSSSSAFAALIGMAAVLLLGVAVGGWYLFRAEPGTISITTTPADAEVYLNDQKIDTSTSSPFVLTGVEPGEHLVEVRKAGYQTWATRVKVSSGESLTLPPVVLTAIEGGAPQGAQDRPPVAGTGFTLDTLPSGATVYVDDRQLPQRTPVTVTDLSPGVHTIRAELPRYAPWTGQIEVREGQVQALPRTVLTLREVTVRFESNPSGARVTLVRGGERRNIGETPTTAQVETAGEPWTVEMSRSGYDDWTAPLTLPSGQAEHTVTATLVERDRTRPTRSSTASSGRTTDRQASGGERETTASSSGGTGTLRVNTTPWSQVYIDGRLIGNTPQMNVRLPAGRHTITFVNPKFNIRERVTVTIRAGQTETLIRRLTPGG